MKSNKPIHSFKLTNNFWFNEFVVSQEHPELVDNIETTEQMVYDINLLCVFVLQPLRDKFGPITITSGIRSPELNVLAKGSDKSQHLVARAADFTCGADLDKVYVHVIADMEWRGQVFYYAKRHFIHIGMPDYNIHKVHKTIFD